MIPELRNVFSDVPLIVSHTSDYASWCISSIVVFFTVWIPIAVLSRSTKFIRTKHTKYFYATADLKIW